MLNRKTVLISTLTALFLVGCWQWVQSVSLTDIPNEMAFGNQAKIILNANHAALEVAVLDAGEDETVTGVWTFSGTNVFTPVTAAASTTDNGVEIITTTITFGTVVMIATDGSDEGESVKLGDFHAGGFTVLSSVANLNCQITAGATSTMAFAIGTVAAADDSSLSGTEVDFIPSTAAAGDASVTNIVFDAILAAPANFDGTSSAKDLYMNWAIDDDNMDDDVTNTVTGTLTIITTKPVDN